MPRKKGYPISKKKGSEFLPRNMQGPGIAERYKSKSMKAIEAEIEREQGKKKARAKARSGRQ